MLRNWIERAVNRSWYGGVGWTFVFLPLIPAVHLFVWARRRYRQSVPFASLGAPVVIVGGLTAGGTGKTPVIIALARELGNRGINVGIVSRGYGRRPNDSMLAVELTHTSETVGDEPLVMKRALPLVPIVVGQSRRDATNTLIREFSCQMVLSDDGLQHYQLPRDFEIAVIDAQRRFGNGWLLPAGPLREPMCRIETVDFVLERNGNDPTCSFAYAPVRLSSLNKQHMLSTQEAMQLWGDSRVVAATGLGQPDQFFTMLRNLGFDATEVFVADHARLMLDEIQTRYQPDVILITEKDAVKLNRMACDNIWVVEIETKLPQALLTAVATLLDKPPY